MKKLTLVCLILLLTVSVFAREGREWNGYNFLRCTRDQQQMIIFGWLMAANAIAEYYGDLNNIEFLTRQNETVEQIRQDMLYFYSYENNLSVPVYIAFVNSQNKA